MEDLLKEIEKLNKDKDFSNKHSEKLESVIGILEEEKIKSQEKLHSINLEEVQTAVINSYKEKKNNLKTLEAQQNFHNKYEKLAKEIAMAKIGKKEEDKNQSYDNIELQHIITVQIDDLIQEISKVLENIVAYNNVDNIDKYKSDLIVIQQELKKLLTLPFSLQIKTKQLNEEIEKLKKDERKLKHKYETYKNEYEKKLLELEGKKKIKR